MLAHTWQRGAVHAAFTDRSGGVSEGSFASLNLAATGGDDPAAVAENLARVTEQFAGRRDAPLVAMRQVHGNDVVAVGIATSGTPVADGLVTAEPGVALMVHPRTDMKSFSGLTQHPALDTRSSPATSRSHSM